MARDLLSDSTSESEDSDSQKDGLLNINEAFAQRFEHNKKREELQKLEEKYGQSIKKRKRDVDESGPSASEESSSSSEDEDDIGELATAALDSEIFATLTAIKSRDPRVYDGATTFYSSIDENPISNLKEVKEKPIFLKDYHRQNLLNGDNNEDGALPSYVEEQENLKNEVVSAIHAAAESDSSDDENLLVAKKRKEITPQNTLRPEDGDKDPELFLSNFMTSRSWIPTKQSTYLPLESDDEEDDRRAEEYEDAYNFRFEDPAKANEKLRTHARDMAAQRSVRRQEMNPRQKKREEEKEASIREKRLRQEERARLRKLRVDEVAGKLKKIKEAAGFRMEDLRPEDWSHLVSDDWDDMKWESEMRKKFGDDYYAAEDVTSDLERSSRKKPKFGHEIDISDIVPEFKDAEETGFVMSEDELQPMKGHKRERDSRQAARKERQFIEQLVDDQLQMELDDKGQARSSGFRYRETSPQSFGLTSLDILLADDSHLNQFAGLKKLAAFRDADKKVKDRKHLGKKARLRKWRQETFGDADGIDPAKLKVNVLEPVDEQMARDGVDLNLPQKKRRRRSKKH